MIRAPAALGRRSLAALALVGWFALAAQLYLAVSGSLAAGHTALAGVVKYLGYFTVLTNLLVAAVLTLLRWWPGSRAGRVAALPPVLAGLALYIAVVGLIYRLVLRELWHPQGLQWLVDALLHVVIPVAYGLFWLFLVPKGGLRWRHGLAWLLYPLVYAAYALLRGALVGLYPYPFLDAAALGYPRVMVNIGLLAGLFLVGGLAIVGLDHVLGRRAPAAERATS